MPWAGLFEKVAQADIFCAFDGVAMEDSGYENRVQIRTSQGPQWLTVPVKRSRDLPLCKVEIANEHGWQRKMIRSIEMSYQRAPYFSRYFPDVKCLLETRHQYLADLDLSLLRYFMQELGINTPIVRASEYDFQGSKSALVLDMCRQLGASAYVFGELGQDYADVPAFAASGVKVRFQKYECREYQQQHAGFVGGLSVLDVLLNCGPDARKVVLG